MINIFVNYLKVPKLSKARPLDNLEMAQWFKAFFDNQGGELPEGYDPIAARGGNNVVKLDNKIKRQ